MEALQGKFRKAEGGEGGENQEIRPSRPLFKWGKELLLVLGGDGSPYCIRIQTGDCTYIALGRSNLVYSTDLRIRKDVTLISLTGCLPGGAYPYRRRGSFWFITRILARAAWRSFRPVAVLAPMTKSKLTPCTVRTLIIERYATRLAAPKAHALSPRSLELARQFGLDVNEIRQIGTSRKDAYWVNFITNLAGEEVGRLPYERMDPEVLDATPTASLTFSCSRADSLHSLNWSYFTLVLYFIFIFIFFTSNPVSYSIRG